MDFISGTYSLLCLEDILTSAAVTAGLGLYAGLAALLVSKIFKLADEAK